MLVRMAVLKGKDPQQILEEMEIIDKQGALLLSVYLTCSYLFLYSTILSSYVRKLSYVIKYVLMLLSTCWSSFSTCSIIWIVWTFKSNPLHNYVDLYLDLYSEVKSTRLIMIHGEMLCVMTMIMFELALHKMLQLCPRIWKFLTPLDLTGISDVQQKSVKCFSLVTVSCLVHWFCVGTEFDPTQPPRLNERVLKDKRKKLRETFDRVINMYVSAVYPVVTDC